MNEELALFAIDYAKQLGAKYSEARIHKIEELTIISRNGAVIGLTKDISNGIGVESSRQRCIRVFGNQCFN